MAAVGALLVVDDLRPAQWLTESIRGFAVDVGSLVPATFGAYARVLHPAYNDGDRVSWAQVARAHQRIAHPQMQFNRLIGYASRYSPGYRDRATRALRRSAGGRGRCPLRLPHRWPAPWLRIPRRLTTAGLRSGTAGAPSRGVFWSADISSCRNRNYHLARGPLAAAAQSVSSWHLHQSCNLWWPDDHAWCVATEIDHDSTYIGASEACIEELLANPDLETVPVEPDSGHHRRQ